MNFYIFLFSLTDSRFWMIVKKVFPIHFSYKGILLPSLFLALFLLLLKFHFLSLILWYVWNLSRCIVCGIDPNLPFIFFFPSNDYSFVPIPRLFCFWPYHITCGILILQPGVKPRTPALKAWTLNHWATRAVP